MKEAYPLGNIYDGVYHDPKECLMTKVFNKKIIIFLGLIYLFSQLVGLYIASFFELSTALAYPQPHSFYYEFQAVVASLFLLYGIAGVGFDLFKNIASRKLVQYKISTNVILIFALPYLLFAIYKFIVLDDSGFAENDHFEQYSAFEALLIEADLSKSKKVGDFRAFSSEGVDLDALVNKIKEAQSFTAELKKMYKIEGELSIPIVITKDNRLFKESSKTGSCFGAAIFITQERFKDKEFTSTLLHEYVHYLNYYKMKRLGHKLPIFVDEVIAYALEHAGSPKDKCSLEYIDREYLKDVFAKLNPDEQLNTLLRSPNDYPKDQLNTHKYQFYRVFGCNLIKDYSLEKVFAWAVNAKSMEIQKAFKFTYKTALINYIEGTNAK